MWIIDFFRNVEVQKKAQDQENQGKSNGCNKTTHGSKERHKWSKQKNTNVKVYQDEKSGWKEIAKLRKVPISSEFKLNQAIRARIYKAVQYFKEAP